MVTNLRSSWSLAKASWSVLKADRELLLFPFLSFLGLVAWFILFSIPIVVLMGNGSLLTADGRSLTPIGWLAPVVFYLVAYTVVFFFNTALIGAAMIRLNGGDPTVRDGFRSAVSHLPAILGWAVIAATVGMLLRSISNGRHPVASGITFILGVAWSVMSFLVVPIIVVENVGPIAALKRSRDLIRRTWGQSLIGGASISAIFGIAAILIVAAAAWIALNVFPKNTAIDAALIGVAVLCAGVLGLIGAALSGIYHASLYRYATVGNAGEGSIGQDAMVFAFESRFKQPSATPGSGLRIHLGPTSPAPNRDFHAPTGEPDPPAPVLDAAPPAVDAPPPQGAQQAN